MVISEFIKRYWQWLLILLSMGVGQFVLLVTLPVATLTYDVQMPQIRTVLPNIGPLEYENDDPDNGAPLRWIANTGELRVLGGVVQSDVLVSLLVHTMTIGLAIASAQAICQAHRPQLIPNATAADDTPTSSPKRTARQNPIRR